MSAKSLKEVWSIIYIDDFDEQAQFGVRMNGREQQIEVYFRNFNYELKTIVFAGDAVAEVSFVEVLFIGLLVTKTKLLRYSSYF